MKKRERLFVKSVFVMFFVVIIISFMPLISGDYIVKNSTGGGGFNHSLGSVELYNFSVNNTFIDSSSNVTRVSIGLPDYLNYTGNNGSSTDSSYDFSNDSGTINWTAPAGEALVMNNSKEYFWFEANSSSADNSFSAVSITNSSGTYSGDGNLEFNVYSSQSEEDYEINVLSPLDGETLTDSDVRFNATFSGGTPSNWAINFNGTNYTGINQSFNIEDGDYNLTVYADYDGKTYKDDSVSFSVDTTPPEINVTSPSEDSILNKNEIWFNFSSDQYVDEWIVNFNGTSGENRTFSGEGDSFSEKINVSMGDWNLYVYAEDSVGNIGINERPYYFTVNSSLSSDEDTSDDNDSQETGDKTYSEADEDLTKKEEGIVQDYLQGEGLKFSVKGDIYYIRVTNLTNSEASLNISDDQDIVLFRNTQGIGDRIEYDLDDDTKKDIMVTVNGISEDKATITVKASYTWQLPGEENQTVEEEGNETQREKPEDKGYGTVFIIVVSIIFAGSLIGVIYYIKKYQEEESRKKNKNKKSMYEDPSNIVGYNK